MRKYLRKSREYIVKDPLQIFRGTKFQKFFELVQKQYFFGCIGIEFIRPQF